jgi:nitroreductase
VKPVDNQTLLKQLDWRYATEKFDPTRKIPAEDWGTLEKALIATASSFNLQPWHFVVITSNEMKQRLLDASWQQPQVKQASHIVVFAVKKVLDESHAQKCVDRTSQVRGVTAESLHGYRHALLKTISRMDSAAAESWSARQVYIAVGTLLTSAALLGIDACPMEGIVPQKFDQILGLDKKGYGTLLITTLGYRAADDDAAHELKVRFKAEDLVTRID